MAGKLFLITFGERQTKGGGVMNPEGRIANWARKAPWFKLGLSLVLVIAGLILTRSSIGEVAIHWMYVYNFQEFTDWSFAMNFFGELRTGISPVWAFADIFSYRTFGNLDLTDKILYRGGMIAMYVLPLWMFARIRWQLVFVFLGSLVCMWATVLIHPGNPQVYDIYMPVLVMALVKILQAIPNQAIGPRTRVGLSLLAGLVLSVTELTRPFVLLFMPIFIVSIWSMLRKFPKVNLIAFLVPILMLSGTWHIKLWVKHRQISWSNHSGFNLYQSWNEFAGYYEFQEPPRHPGLSPNINTEIHYQRSMELTRVIRQGIMKHPWGAVKHVGFRATQFFAPQTELLSAKPDHWIFGPYRVVVWLLSLGLILALAVAIKRLIATRFKSFWAWISDPETMLLLFTTFNIAIFIVVEAREDARFLISVLPYLLCLPGMQWMLRGWRSERRE